MNLDGRNIGGRANHSSGIVATKRIPVMRPLLPSSADVAPYLRRMDAARTYSNFGPLTHELAYRLATFLRVDNPERLVLGSSATTMLEGVCNLSDVSTFAVPDFTFPATAHAVLRAGKQLHLYDVSPSDWQLPDSTTESNEGIVRVLPFGAAPQFDRDRTASIVVIDAAASLGSHQLDLSQMSGNQVIVFSLHATKILGIGEGGLAVLPNVDMARALRSWLNFGFAGTRESQVVATNGKLSEVMGAYGLAALDAWEFERRDWVLVNSWARELSLRLGIASIVSSYQGVTPYWITEFPTRENADLVCDEFNRAGIETRRWWEHGLHQMPAFRDLAVQDFPEKEKIAERTVGLPMFRDLSPESFARIEDALEQITIP